MAQKPRYSIKDLAELLGVTQEAMHARVKSCQEKPEVSTHTMVSRRPGVKRPACLYDKEQFLDWHRRYYGHLEVPHGGSQK